MSRTVADVMVETLQQAGARRCYGVPGDTLNYFTDAEGPRNGGSGLARDAGSRILTYECKARVTSFFRSAK